MPILLLFAFISGLVTILAPCIWPILPIIFSSSATGGKFKALGISLGISSSFAVFTLTLSYLVTLFKFDPDVLRIFAVVVLVFLGLSLIVPYLTGRLEVMFSKLSGLIQVKDSNRSKAGFWAGLVTGFTLGLVWSPCAGPILSTIATLSATRTVNFGIILVTLAYTTGVFIVLYLFSLGGNRLFNRSRVLTKYTPIIQKIFGVIIILTAVSIYTNYDKVLQVKLLDAIPSYSTFLYKLEGSETINQELQKLKNAKNRDTGKVELKPFNQVVLMGGTNLPILGRAPEFTGIYKWLNSQGPITMESLEGKVVLVDFWTYTCINCIRTLPHVTGWYEKYKDKNFTIIGVHTPEFEFEKKTENVEMAIKQYKINYPVAQDNDYKTWNAYNNRYWPAKYLIDAKGNLRKFHFGEGKYEEMEEAIRELIEENGQDLKEEMSIVNDQTPKGVRTPEIYLGLDRMDKLISGDLESGDKIYTTEGKIPVHHVAYEGKWNVDHEFSQSYVGSELILNYFAEKVFLVIHPGGENDQVKVFLDGKEQNILTVSEPKLYELINLNGKSGEHLLKLEFLNEGTRIFAFTFG